MLSDVTYDMGSPDDAAGLVKDGVERDLQELLADQPEWCGEGFRLVRREWPTDIGPVDLMCRDEEDGWIAVEIKRVATIDAVEQLHRYLERIRLDPALGDVPRACSRRRSSSPRPGCSPRRAGSPASRSTSRCCAASASPTSRCSPRDPLAHQRHVAAVLRSCEYIPSPRSAAMSTRTRTRAWRRISWRGQPLSIRSFVRCLTPGSTSMKSPAIALQLLVAGEADLAVVDPDGEERLLRRSCT